MEVLRNPLKLARNQKGLTLIELLAVLIILGIILAIAVPSVVGVINRSKLQADIGSLNLIKDAGLRYALANNLTAASTTITVENLRNEGYLNEVPAVQSNKVNQFGSVKIEFNGNKYTVKVYVETANPTTEITESTFTNSTTSSSTTSS